MSGYDAEAFGKLCSNVEHIKETVDEVKMDLKDHKEKVEDRLDEHSDRITKIESEKKWIWGTIASLTGGGGILAFFKGIF